MCTNSRLDDGIAEMNEEIMQHFLVEGAPEASPTPMEEHAQEELGGGPALSHVDARGKAKMVDVSGKATTTRSATASAWIAMARGHDLSEEEVVAAQLAGIRGAKLTSLMIPLCHPINLSSVDVNLDPLPPDLSSHQTVLLSATATSSGQTGVEMEALSALTFAALHFVLSSSSSSSHSLSINQIVLNSKKGGKSGDYIRPKQDLDTSHATSTSYEPPPPSSSAAVARMTLPSEAWRGLIDNCNKKGNVLVVSRLAGLLAMQQKSFLLPLHTLPCVTSSPAPDGVDSQLTDLKIVPLSDADGLKGQLVIRATSSSASHRALLLGVAATALTVYDMCKAASKNIQIDEIKILKG